MTTNSPWLTLIRHTEVAERYQNTCYGASNVELSQDGEIHAERIAHEMATAASSTTHIFHSGLGRAKHLAEAIASHLRIEPAVDGRLAELNFGDWELKTWEQIFDEVGHDMSKLITEPETYAPPAGETAHALRDRIYEWFLDLPSDGTIIAVSHAGPISALRGTLAGHPADQWPKLIPAFGEPVSVASPDTMTATTATQD